MKYQIVLQFPETLLTFDYLVRMEDDFVALLKNDDIDGHDIGSGEINIFILTDSPINTFERLKQYLVSKELLNSVKVAYRDLNSDIYKILYPDTLKEFDIR